MTPTIYFTIGFIAALISVYNYGRREKSHFEETIRRDFLVCEIMSRVILVGLLWPFLAVYVPFYLVFHFAEARRNKND